MVSPLSIIRLSTLPQYSRDYSAVKAAARGSAPVNSYTALVLRYAITDSRRFGDSFVARRDGLLAQTERLVVQGVDYIQLREKDLETGELLMLANAIADLLRAEDCVTKLLINSRADVAVAAHADGVHRTAHPDELTPQQVREIFVKAHSNTVPIISTSCHTQDHTARAADNRADIILFGPVFEKRVGAEHIADGTGVLALRDACSAAKTVPVLALGGITPANTSRCLRAGAAGIAGIRIFL